MGVKYSSGRRGDVEKKSDIMLCVLRHSFYIFLSNASRQVQRYLRWLGIDTEIFNVGCERQKLANHIDHTFFDFHNANGMSQREQAAETTLTAMLNWFDEGKGTVGIYDGSNCTRARRAWIHKELTSRGIEVLFIESICQDESIIQSNIQDIISKNPDYQDMDPADAEADFKERVKHYEEMYETITEDHLTYLKIIDANQQCIINLVRGYLESRIVYFLMNVKIRPKSIWFSRVSREKDVMDDMDHLSLDSFFQHGESQFNVEDKIGGDADLSSRGQMYASRLPDLIKEHVGDRPLTVWTSSMKRTIQTASHLPYPKKSWKALDELNTGVCDGMTYAEIEVCKDDVESWWIFIYMHTYRKSIQKTLHVEMRINSTIDIGVERQVEHEKIVGHCCIREWDGKLNLVL